jgi:hypothetical protein
MFKHTSCSVLSLFAIDDNFMSWKVLCLNIRGVNSDKKCNSIRDRIVESQCDILCLQGTKREHFDLPFVRSFFPHAFGCFEFLP